MTFDLTFWTGIAGSLTLVAGAAWPEPKAGTRPVESAKNWLFFVGGLLMLLYAIMGWMQGGAVFYVFLELFILIAGILMMLDTDDRIDLGVISVSGIFFILWSLFLFEDYGTIIFILGLIGIGLGYAFKVGTVRRNALLTLGSALIAVYSYMGASWIFFWLNAFFAVFSSYYLLKLLAPRPHRKSRP